MNGRQKRVGLLVNILLILFVLFIGCTTNVEAKVKKDADDVKALNQIIKEQESKGVRLCTRFDDKRCYKWNDKTGRLEKIDWEYDEIKGTSKTFKKLKPKKPYYIQIRAYSIAGKEKIYGTWSKKVKVKKVKK